MSSKEKKPKSGKDLEAKPRNSSHRSCRPGLQELEDDSIAGDIEVKRENKKDNEGPLPVGNKAPVKGSDDEASKANDGMMRTRYRQSITSCTSSDRTCDQNNLDKMTLPCYMLQPLWHRYH